MDTEQLKSQLKGLVKHHREVFSEIPSRRSALLELAAFVGVREHYRSNGFEVETVNPGASAVLKLKTFSRGHPWNYSRAVLTKGRLCAEVHSNLMTEGAHGAGQYCVDVGICRVGRVPAAKPRRGWRSLGNKDLLSFVEVKSLMIYPMLLAQFVGIVHEIKPRFLRRPKVRLFDRYNHLPPSLLVLGRFSGTSDQIVRDFIQRGVQVHIAEQFDGRMAAARVTPGRSPLFWDD